MRHPTRVPLLALFGMSFMTMGLACSDSTAPLASHLQGTYELTTILDSLTYADYCSLPTSSISVPVCHDTTVATTKGVLDGTLTLGDTVQGSPQEIVVPITGAALRQTSCESCTPAVNQYYAASATVARNEPRFKAHLFGGSSVDLDGVIAGPVITGRVVFYTYIGCCSQTYYTGMFIMKRRE